MTNAPSLAGRLATPVKWASILLTIVALIVMIRVLPFDRLVGSLKGWIDDLGFWGLVVFALIYVVATVLLLPGSALTLAAGAIFGLAKGTIAVWLGATSGAAATFLIGRYVARDKVARMAKQYPTFDAIDQAVSDGGWKIVALLRLSPAVPFNLQNYLYGVTAIRFWPCVLASAVFMLPGTFMYVYFGYVGGAGIAAAADAQGSTDAAKWALRIVGLVATVAVTIYVTRLATRAIKQKTKIAAENGAAATSPAPAEPKAPAGWTRGVTIAAVIAVLSVTGAVFARINADAVAQLFNSVLGPPSVTLQESYDSRDGGPRFDHSALDDVLRTYVDDQGLVDYSGLKADSSRLDAYLASLADAPFDDLGRDEKLTLLINAYNASTLRLILDQYPIASIKDIPADARWDGRRWPIAGQQWTLNEIEHTQIRPNFAEPRIHFALVCAAIGCPPLRNEAYAAARLEAQLDDQARFVHQPGRWFRSDDAAAEISLTKLYDWYGDDFRQAAGSVPAFAARYVPNLKTALDAGRSPRIQWLEYDWKLNDQADAAGRQP